MTASPAPDRRRARQRQLENSLANTSWQLVELIRERVEFDARISFNLVNRIVINGTHVGVIFVDDSDGQSPSWRRR
jgi:hypothetical protein